MADDRALLSGAEIRRCRDAGENSQGGEADHCEKSRRQAPRPDAAGLGGGEGRGDVSRGAPAADKQRAVDDGPAGGGPGMVLRADVLARAIDAVAGDARPRLAMSARGVPLTQERVDALAKGPGAVILCGRFEGIDQRLIEG